MFHGPDGFVTCRSNHFGTTNETIPCHICHDIGLRKFHQHHSTAYQFARFEDVVKCAYCKIWHSPCRENRISVIFSDSTLHDVFLEPHVRSPIHIDTETICGGRLRDGKLNWDCAYGNMNRGIDTTIVLGLNDIRSQNVRVKFVQELEDWGKMVAEHGEKFSVKNTLGISRLLNAPALVWYSSS